MSQLPLKKIFFFLPFFWFTSFTLQSQVDTAYQYISAIVTLDSFVVTATRKGFDVEDFIKLVREDKSFYQAFRNLRFVTYTSDNDVKMYSKKQKVKAHYQSQIHQISDGHCRTMEVLSEQVIGDFFKKKTKHRYYTGELHDRLFLTHGEICETRTNEFKTADKGMEKHVSELKRLIFQPGEKVNVPLLGNKTAIFDPKMMRFYDYSITSKFYESEIDCYVFTVKIKPEFEEKKEGKTVIKFLETYFEKKTFQVIARNYQLQHQTAVYDFDVTMNIKLTKIGETYLPEWIAYDGQWDIPLRKPEISKFWMRFYGFE